MNRKSAQPARSARDGIIAAIGIGLGAVAGALLGVTLRLAAAVASGSFARGKRRKSVAPDAPREPEPLRPGWSRPLPEHMVKPTYWPMVVAFGIALLLWGVVSSPIISAIGLFFFILGMANWIGELRRDARE
jgi:hypothetical protein